MRDALWYHFGSIVFGSCVIAIARMACITLEYIIYRIKQAGGKRAKIIHAAAGVLRCIVYCIAKQVESISESGYISVMMTGCSFADGCMLASLVRKQKTPRKHRRK